MAYNDLSGKRFKNWQVLYRVTNKSQVYFMCICDCGTKREVYSGNLTSGKSTSCGCLSKERIAKINYKHGKTHTINFRTWLYIKDRCFNKTGKHWDSHGGRGITLYSNWINDFEAFDSYIKLNLGERPKGYSLDRINNNGNYEPGNIRWACARTQANNTRHNRSITYLGQTKTIAEWSRETGITYKTLYYRCCKSDNTDIIFKKTNIP